jgi:pimeloyl-ACP methyl ester carboxylesterase
MALALKGEGAYYASLWSQHAALVKLPVHILWGMQDPAFKPELLTRWQEALPHAQVTRLEGVGHFPAEEDPAAVVTALRALMR